MRNWRELHTKISQALQKVQGGGEEEAGSRIGRQRDRGGDIHSAMETASAANPESAREKSHKEAAGGVSEAVDGGKEAPNTGEEGAKKSRGVRFVLKDSHLFEKGCENWVRASPAAQKKMEMEAIFAMVLRKNVKKVAEEKGIPLEVFKEIWAEYKETRQFQGTSPHNCIGEAPATSMDSPPTPPPHPRFTLLEGKFFHRDEVPVCRDESSREAKMISAIAMYRANGGKVRKAKDEPECWRSCGASKRSFYKALAWEKENPGRRWDGPAIRQRGKESLLTDDMEEEMKHFVCISQKQSGGVSISQTCRAAFDLMSSDPEHCERVKKDHKEYRDGSRKAFGKRWFHRFKKRHPDVFAKHKAEAYCGGRAMVDRAMVDSVYDVLQVGLLCLLLHQPLLNPPPLPPPRSLHAGGSQRSGGTCASSKHLEFR